MQKKTSKLLFPVRGYEKKPFIFGDMSEKPMKCMLLRQMVLKILFSDTFQNVFYC